MKVYRSRHLASTGFTLVELLVVIGRPCDNALVVFHPLEKGRLNDPKPVAKTDKDGHFVLTTFAENDGALPGEYAVTVVWPGQDPKASKMSMTGEGGSRRPRSTQGQVRKPKQSIVKSNDSQRWRAGAIIGGRLRICSQRK